MPGLIQDWVARSAQRFPDHTAIAWGGERLTYADLERATNRVARMLIDAGCERGDRVALCLPKCQAAYVGMVGALKADCVYVPIDAESPASRVRKVFESCEPRVVLATRATAKLLDEVFAGWPAAESVRVGSLDAAPPSGKHFAAAFCGVDLAAVPDDPVPCRNQSTDAAHILFTSGSTGTPKGVVITHESVRAFVEWGVGYFGINDADRVSGHAPLHFDLSTFDTYGAFAASAELHPVPPEVNLIPHKLADFIRVRELTQWFSVPSILNFLAKFDAVLPQDFPFLKRLMWCGEVFPTPALRYWMQRLPHVTFTNLYGPTEATVASSFYTVPQCPAADTEAVPIGRACAGEELLVLNERLERTVAGATGDLYIGGVGLSPGYWRDPEKTVVVFRPHPFRSDPRARVYKTGDLARVGEEDLIYFLGRADTQIKCRGYRIELGEIETALGALSFLGESAIVAIDTDGFENKAICCAYVPSQGENVTVTRIRTALAAAVPKYMLPQHWLSFPKLPKNANGKIDRPQLREMFSQQPATAALAAHGGDSSPELCKERGLIR